MNGGWMRTAGAAGDWAPAALGRRFAVAPQLHRQDSPRALCQILAASPRRAQ